jgi:hypothetical protein
VGVVLTLAPVFLPKYEPYLPSASAFGLAWVFHWYYGLLFFLGALAALLLQRREPKLAEEFTLPVAWGVVWWPEGPTAAAFSRRSSAVSET